MMGPPEISNSCGRHVERFFRRGYFFALTCARRRSSCSLSSGVSSAPKSSASNTWRISISDSAPGKGLGQRLTHSIASSLTSPETSRIPRSAPLSRRRVRRSRSASFRRTARARPSSSAGALRLRAARRLSPALRRSFPIAVQSRSCARWL